MRTSAVLRGLVVIGALGLGLPLAAAPPAAAAADGDVLAWGNDEDHQLGDGGYNIDRSIPESVVGLEVGSGVVAVSAGARHSLALRLDGTVLSWGNNFFGELGRGYWGYGGDAGQVVGLGPGSGVVAVSAGGAHNLALRSDGSVVAWGDGFDGQIGDGEPEYGGELTPVPVTGLGAGSGVIAVAAGATHSLALRSDGSVLSWGSDSYGQLGADEEYREPAPVPVSGLGPGSGVVAIDAGAYHNMALRADGSVLAWGSNASGQIGLGDIGYSPVRPSPDPVLGLGAGSGVVAVSAGSGHSLARRADGSVLAWGNDGSGQLGDDDAKVNQLSPVPVSGMGAGSGVVAVAAGSSHTLALRADGSVLAWGSDYRGQVGDGGDAVSRTTPTAVSGLGFGSQVVTVAAGGAHSLAARDPYRNRPTYHPLTPARVWDTRGGPGPTGRLAAGSTRNVNIAGAGGIPASGATAVVLNVTAVSPSASTYVTVWPTGEARPATSNLNLPAGDVRPNLVTVKVGAGGQVSFFTGTGAVDLVADVAGWFGPGGERYTAVSPARVWDTRVGPGSTGRMGPGGVRQVAVSGVGGVPGAGVSAVVLNVTAVSPTAWTYLTVWPAGEARPPTSNLNIPPGDTRANQVIVKTGAFGMVSVTNAAGTVDVVADVAGHFTQTGASLTAVSPSRLWDSRSGPGPLGRIGAGGLRDLQVAGRGGVPPTGATSVVLNVTAVNPTVSTYLTVWPTGEGRPNTSSLNVPVGDTRANLVTVKLGASGWVSFSNAAGVADVLVDVAGWYGPPGA